MLFKQGDKGDTFWIIIKGEVSIYKRVFQRHDEVEHKPEAEKNKAGLLNYERLIFFFFQNILQIGNH